MQVVQIELTIPESRQGFGFFVLGDLAVVAPEAKFVVFLGVLDIKIFREILVQGAKMFAAVGVVAGTAVAVPYWSVLVLLGCHIFTHIGVAREAECCWRCREQAGKLRRVGVVALSATAVGDRSMGVVHGSGAGQLLVAREAQFRRFLNQEEVGFAGVRLVAVRAAISGRCVDMTHLHHGLLFFVALKADIFRSSHQLIGKR